LATCQFVRDARDLLSIGPPGVGRSHLAQALGYEAIKADFTVKYRSIFDMVRDFKLDDAYGGEDKILAKYLKPDLLIIDDMGLKRLPSGAGEYLFEVIMRRHQVRCLVRTVVAAVLESMDDDLLLCVSLGKVPHRRTRFLGHSVDTVLP